MTGSIELRPVKPEDMDFLYRVYASTRMEELSVLDWDDAQKESFLHMQFQAQNKHYREYYYDSQFLVIRDDDKDVGRLYVLHLPREIRIVDIALLPEARNKGTGTKLLRELLDEGRKKGLPVSIHVEHNNPALNLYKRLGFKKIEDAGLYHLMEWTPD